MAYNRPRRSPEPPSSDPEAQKENTIPAVGPYTAITRPSDTPLSEGVGSAPDEQWSVVDPSPGQKTHQVLSGNVQKQEDTPTPKPRNWNVSGLVRPPQNPLTSMQQEVLMERIRRDIGPGTAQPSQMIHVPDIQLSGPTQQPNNRRSYIQPLRLPRIPGSVHPQASRSPSSPELRSSERPFYRPMSGISPPNMPPTARLQPLFPSLRPADTRVPFAAISGNSNPTREYVAANDSPCNELDGALKKLALGFSPAYNGDPNLERNRSADVPNELNCSLFLVNLPPDLTTHRLITAIHAMGPTGRIYATHINSPEPDRQHFGCAAKVIFFERQAARCFYALCEEHGFTIDGFAARVMWNRIKTAEQAHSDATTRVLLIAGDRQFVNPSALTEYFRTKLQFQIDCIIPYNDGLNGELAVVEYRFGSFRCQAEAAKMALVREHQDVKCFFYKDPCDPKHPGWSEMGFKWPTSPPLWPTGLAPVPEDQEAQEDDHAGNVVDGSLRYADIFRYM